MEAAGCGQRVHHHQSVRDPEMGWEGLYAQHGINEPGLLKQRKMESKSLGVVKGIYLGSESQV